MDVTTEESPAVESSSTESQVPTDRDVSSINPSDYPERALPRINDLRKPGFQAVIARSALNDMHRHGRSQRDVEVCGVLVGNVYHDEHGPYLYVEASIKGDHAAGKTAQVTFTADTWNHINNEMEQNYVGRKILGWYHTHPGFGIFLSEMDLFIQNNFFPEPWQVAHVYDPKSYEEGLFVWRNGKATREAFLVDPDTINTDPPKHQLEAAQPPTTATLGELMERLQLTEQKVRWLIIAVLSVAVLALIAPLLMQLILPSPAEPAPAAPPAQVNEIPASLQIPTTVPTR